MLLVGDNRQQDKVTLRNVVRIDSASGAPVPIPGAQPQPQAQPQAAPAADGQPGEAQQKPAVPNLISFEKGVGSSNFDASRMTPEVQAALAKYQSQGGQLPGQAPGASPGGGRSFSPDGSVKSSTPEQPIAATGFPNGLSSQDSANNDETEKGGEE